MATPGIDDVVQFLSGLLSGYGGHVLQLRLVRREHQIRTVEIQLEQEASKRREWRVDRLASAGEFQKLIDEFRLAAVKIYALRMVYATDSLIDCDDVPYEQTRVVETYRTSFTALEAKWNEIAVRWSVDTRTVGRQLIQVARAWPAVPSPASFQSIERDWARWDARMDRHETAWQDACAADLGH